RLISASGNDVALFPMSTSSRLWIGSSVMRVSRSCQHILGLHQRAGEDVDLVPSVIHPERRPAGRGDTIAAQQRHRAMGSRTHCDAGAVDDGCDVVRMCTFHLKRNDWPPVLRVAEDADRI